MTKLRAAVMSMTDALHDAGKFLDASVQDWLYDVAEEADAARELGESVIRYHYDNHTGAAKFCVAEMCKLAADA